MDIIRVKFLYSDEKVVVRLIVNDSRNENCISWISPNHELREVIKLQEEILKRVTDTSADIVSHNQISAKKFMEISARIEKCPGIMKSIYEDISAIHSSIKRMKKKLRIPIYKPPENE